MVPNILRPWEEQFRAERSLRPDIPAFELFFYPESSTEPRSFSTGPETAKSSE